MKRFVAMFGTAALGIAASAMGASISLTPGSPTYNYDILASGGDPNAVLTGTMHATADASYYTNDASTGTLTYTFDVSAGATNLKIDEYNLFAFGGTGSISAGYTIDAGLSVPLYTDSTSVLAPGGGDVTDVHHVDNIALSPAVAHTVVLTYTNDATADSGYQQQLIRHSTGDGGPFIATATFTPEPASLGVFSIAGVSLLARRRRA